MDKLEGCYMVLDSLPEEVLESDECVDISHDLSSAVEILDNCYNRLKVLHKKHFKIGGRMRYYTGIGSREIPEEIKEVMGDIAKLLAKHGFVLRSGGANGSDLAFQRACEEVDGAMNIYLPWQNFNGFKFDGEKFFLLTKAEKGLARQELLSSGIIPHFDNMRVKSKLFHSRNYCQVFGQNEKPSEFVIFYAPENLKGEVMGGTRTAVFLGIRWGVPVFNLYHKDALENFYKFLERNYGITKEKC